jgi:hypothetical protein
MGGGMTEMIDDVAFAHAPVAADGAFDLLQTLHTVRRMSNLMSDFQAQNAANFIAGFSQLAASAPWPDFTLQVNPLKLGIDSASALDGLLVIGSLRPATEDTGQSGALLVRGRAIAWTARSAHSWQPDRALPSGYRGGPQS